MAEQALDLHSCMTEENKRRRRTEEGLVLVETYFRTIVAMQAYIHGGRRPREPRNFSDHEHRHTQEIFAQRIYTCSPCVEFIFKHL